MARILLVEDNPLNREFTVDLLHIGGYEVVATERGEDALTLATEHQPDLIILDIALPGIDGLEVARKLKADPHLGHIPLLAVTAHAMKGDQEAAMQVGFSGYVRKPVDTRTFLLCVRSFLPTE